MKVGYAMIRNSTDPIEDQIASLKKAGCDVIYKETLIDKTTGLPALRDLLENLFEGTTVVIESLNVVAPNMDAPPAFFEILIERECSLELTSENKIYTFDELPQQRQMWIDLLESRMKIRSRRSKKRFS